MPRLSMSYFPDTRESVPRGFEVPGLCSLATVESAALCSGWQRRGGCAGETPSQGLHSRPPLHSESLGLWVLDMSHGECIIVHAQLNVCLGI